MSDIATDEALLIGYEYNQQKPRFYSKLTAQNRVESDVSLSEAILGSCSLLEYFLPYKMYFDITNEESIVGGEIIAQNPSFYSSILAKEVMKKKYVRIISVGTGYSDFSDISLKSGGAVVLSILQD